MIQIALYLLAVTINEDLSVCRVEIEWRERYSDHNMLVFPDVRCVKLPHWLLLRSDRREPVLHSKVISTLKEGGTAARNEPSMAEGKLIFKWMRRRRRVCLGRRGLSSSRCVLSFTQPTCIRIPIAFSQASIVDGYEMFTNADPCALAQTKFYVDLYSSGIQMS